MLIRNKKKASNVRIADVFAVIYLMMLIILGATLACADTAGISSSDPPCQAGGPDPENQ